MVRKKVTGKKTAKKTLAKTSTKKVSVAKTAKKRTTNRLATRTVKKAVGKVPVKSSPIQEYEQTIAKARAELGKALIKAVVPCQRAVEKIQTQLNGALARQKAQRDKRVAASQRAAETGTQGAKNQAARAREVLRVLNEKVRAIRDDLKAAKLALNSANSAQKKFAAAEKTLERFEQEWNKAATPKKGKVKRRPRKVTATEAKEGTSASTSEEAEVATLESETPAPVAATET